MAPASWRLRALRSHLGEPPPASAATVTAAAAAASTVAAAATDSPAVPVRPRLSRLSRSVAGRVAVVTGAASGQGDATVRVLADEGCRLALCDISSCAALAAEINALGGEAACFTADLGERASVEKMAEEILARFDGEVDILVNNAGMSGGMAMSGGATSDDFFAQWARAQAVNLTAQVALSRKLLPALARNGDGRIVNVASTEGIGASLANAS